MLIEIVGALLIKFTGARIVSVQCYSYQDHLDSKLTGVTVFDTHAANRTWNGYGGDYDGSAEIAAVNYTTGGNCNNGTPNDIFLDLVWGYRWEITAADCSQNQDTLILDLRCGDMNSDGFKDAIDYDLFVLWWDTNRDGADLNVDGFVDAIDYDLFLHQWLYNDACE